MIHRGRDRYKTHAGIPHGSTLQLATKLSIYFQWKEGVSVDGTTVISWKDQSDNSNDCVQEVEGDQAVYTSDGGLDFEQTESHHYDLSSQVALSYNEGFCCFLVCAKESTSGNNTILGLSDGAHFLELYGGGNSVRFRAATTTTTISPGDGTQGDFNPSDKMVITISRDSGGTGNIHLYKNGTLLPQDSQAANQADGEFNQISCRNADRYFDGVIYDIAFVEANANTSNVIEKINTYLKSKHGIN